MQKEIKELEKLVADFDFLFQEGVIMSNAEHTQATKLIAQLSDTVRDFYLNNPAHATNQ